MESTTQTQTRTKYCRGCDDNLENQQGHYGGCMTDPLDEYLYSQEYYQEYSQDNEGIGEIDVSNDIISETDSFSFSITPENNYIDTVEFQKSIKDVWGYYDKREQIPLFDKPILALKLDALDSYTMKTFNQIEEFNEGDWVYTYYHIPIDCLTEHHISNYLQDYFYKASPNIAIRLENAIGSPIQYNIPTDGHFQQPRDNETFYYGHPALYDPETKGRIKCSNIRARFLKKIYKLNQRRIATIARFLNIKHYTI